MPSSESSHNVNKRHVKNSNSAKTSQQQSDSELNKSTSEQQQQPSSYQSALKTNGDLPTDPGAGLLNLTGVKTLLLVTALTCVCITGFMTRLFSVIRYESIIHEFDPW